MTHKSIENWTECGGGPLKNINFIFLWITQIPIPISVYYCHTFYFLKYWPSFELEAWTVVYKTTPWFTNRTNSTFLPLELTRDKSIKFCKYTSTKPSTLILISICSLISLSLWNKMSQVIIRMCNNLEQTWDTRWSRSLRSRMIEEPIELHTK